MFLDTEHRLQLGNIGEGVADQVGKLALNLGKTCVDLVNVLPVLLNIEKADASDGNLQ